MLLGEKRPTDKSPTRGVRWAACAAALVCLTLLPITAMGGDHAFMRGDMNGDGSVNIGDPVAILSYLADLVEITCEDAADANDDGGTDVVDVVYLLHYIFLDGAPPPPPFAACGTDPTPDDVGCEDYPACP